MPTVTELANRGYYEPKLPFPDGPADDPAVREARIAYNLDKREQRNAFKADALAETELLDLPKDVQDAIFEEAWERGHANGYAEVMSELCSLATLAKKIIGGYAAESGIWSARLNSLSLLLGRYESAVKDGRMEHLPAVTDQTLRDLHELHRACSKIDWDADEYRDS